MTGLSSRWAFSVLVILAGLLARPAISQEIQTHPSAWQAVISGQIEAFRAGQDATALFYAGKFFRSAYTSPANFVRAIRLQGYEAIFESVGHTFGNYDLVTETSVLQIVDFQGGDLHAYRALYQVGLEDEGWRIQGVMLREMPGVNI
jgi:hypothetical protein